MRIERRLFIDVKSHWSWVCVLSEKFELCGWHVLFHPEINAIDIVKYRYDGLDLVDDMREIIDNIGSTRGAVRAIYDLTNDKNITRWIE